MMQRIVYISGKEYITKYYSRGYTASLILAKYCHDRILVIVAVIITQYEAILIKSATGKHECVPDTFF